MRLQINVLLDYALAQPADVLLQVEAAATAGQRLIEATLNVTSPEPLRAVPGEEGFGQRCWTIGEGRLTANYAAIVEIDRSVPDLQSMHAVAPRDLPGEVVRYVLPSRYVECDAFDGFVRRRFGHRTGGGKIAEMRDWIMANIAYVSGASDGSTTAANTFVRREGVCRDFAHLLTAFARAGGIPARLVSVYAPGVDPPDFHAVVEVWLDGAWHLVDPTGMAHPDEMARIVVGRDATDIAFMTIFGRAMLIAQQVSVVRA